MNLHQAETIVNKEVLLSEGLNSGEKKNLTANISTLNSYQISNHRNNCSICQHPESDLLHKHLLSLNFKEVLGKVSLVRGKEVTISETSILSHLNKLNMYNDIGQLQRMHQFKTLIMLDTHAEAMPTNHLSMNDQLNKQAGVYKADARDPLDELMSATAQALLGSRLKPTDAGDSGPLAQIDSNDVSSSNKGEFNQ